MFLCTNCGNEMEELFRRYCPSVLKLLKCDKCGQLADKYIEYDPAIIFVDLILVEKQAYRHLLYNSRLRSCWKLTIVLWLSESFSSYAFCDSELQESLSIDGILRSGGLGDCNFYWILFKTAFSLSAFILTVLLFTEAKWWLLGRRPGVYGAGKLVTALVIGGCGRLLGLLGIIWRHSASVPHWLLVQGYTVLCLLAGYSVVCGSSKSGSLLALVLGFLGYSCAYGLSTSALEVLAETEAHSASR